MKCDRTLSRHGLGSVIPLSNTLVYIPSFGPPEVVDPDLLLVPDPPSLVTVFQSRRDSLRLYPYVRPALNDDLEPTLDQYSRTSVNTPRSGWY